MSFSRPVTTITRIVALASPTKTVLSQVVLGRDVLYLYHVKFAKVYAYVLC